MATVGEKMTAIADAIRTKTGKTDKLTLDAMASNLNAIAERTSSNLTASGATVTVPAGNYKAQATKSVSTVTRADTTISVSADDTNDKLTITASNNQGTGYVTGANKTATKTITLTASGSSVTASDGTNKVSKSVATATQATPSISVNSSGLITASATQTAGYVAAGTKSGTKQLTTKAAATITPKTSNQTIASGTYLTGTQTIKGDANLVASNIKKGASIFGVSGSYEGAELNFTVVGDDTAPENPTENTIWINTTTPISSWEFSATQPTASSGKVWIYVGTSSAVEFNMLKQNTAKMYPISAKQYISGAWINKTAKSYQNNNWVDWIVHLYNHGDEYQTLTGGWKIEGNATKGDDGVYFPVDQSTRYADCYTNAKVNLTNTSTVNFIFNGQIQNGGGGTNVTVWIANKQLKGTFGSANIELESGAVLMKILNPNTLTSVGTLMLDTGSANLSGEYFVGAHVAIGGLSADIVHYVSLSEIQIIR